MKLKTVLLSALLVSSTLTADEASIKKEGVGYIKILGKALKTQMKEQMKMDKTGLGAMGFCSSSAEVISNDINKELPENILVRRTALKIRNDNNQPDEIDEKVMNEYQASIDAKTFKPTDIKVVVDGNTTRVYKALVTEKVCLKCHGTNIIAPIAKEIKTHYPEDRAIGFTEGSLRGVIVAEISKVEDKENN